MFSDAVDAENESTSSEAKATKETIDFKELKRVDHILASLQRKVTQIFSWSVLFGLLVLKKSLRAVEVYLTYDAEVLSFETLLVEGVDDKEM